MRRKIRQLLTGQRPRGKRPARPCNPQWGGLTDAGPKASGAEVKPWGAGKTIQPTDLFRSPEGPK
jgi:hypothetical protein